MLLNFCILGHGGLFFNRRVWQKTMVFDTDELSQSMRFSLMSSDTAVSQRNVFDPLVEWTTKGAVLPVKNQRQSRVHSKVLELMFKRAAF